MLMIEKAVEKLTGEMNQEKDPLIDLIGDRLIQRCTSFGYAEKILQDGKTIKAATKLMWDKAREIKKGNGAYIHDDELLDMAEEYFGIGKTVEVQRVSQNAGIIDITDLLEG